MYTILASSDPLFSPSLTREDNEYYRGNLAALFPWFSCEARELQACREIEEETEMMACGRVSLPSFFLVLTCTHMPTLNLPPLLLSSFFTPIQCMIVRYCCRGSRELFLPLFRPSSRRVFISSSLPVPYFAFVQNINELTGIPTNLPASRRPGGEGHSSRSETRELKSRSASTPFLSPPPSSSDAVSLIKNLADFVPLLSLDHQISLRGWEALRIRGSSGLWEMGGSSFASDDGPFSL